MTRAFLVLALVAVAFLALCAAIWCALIADGDLPHYDNPGDVQDRADVTEALWDAQVRSIGSHDEEDEK